jgi:hypothetical protein
MKDKDDQETHKLLKNSKNKDFFDAQRSLLSRNFLIFLKVLNIAFILYITISTLFYICVHYYGKRVIQAKSLRLEYDNLLYQNLFVNFYFIMITLLGFITTKHKSMKYFALYFSTLIVYSFIYLYAYLTNLNISHFLSNKFFWFSSLIVGITSIILVVMVFHFFSVIEENKTYLRKHSTTNNIFHEICLRTDMMKFTFNHFLIRTRLHKFLPNLAFKKDSYYFTSLSPITSDYSHQTDNIDSLHNNLRKEHISCRNNNLSTSTNSRRGLDSTCYKS